MRSKKWMTGMIIMTVLCTNGCAGKGTEQSNKVVKEYKTDQGKEEKESSKEKEEQITISTEKPDKPKRTKKPARATKEPVPEDEEMVLVQKYIPDIRTELRYATKNNFTGKIIYDFKEAYLRYGTVRKLKKAQKEVKKENLGILIWDAYRPVAAQFKLWEICPDSTYVANPNKGYSSHSKGNTVDITLISLEDGEKVTMPTDFDDFSKKADRDYSDCTEEESFYAKKLEKTMMQCGFKPYSGEWWHFSDQISYDVVEALPKNSK